MYFLHVLRLTALPLAIVSALSHAVHSNNALASNNNQNNHDTLTVTLRDHLDIQPAISDCMRNSHIDYSRLCTNSALDYEFRDRVAIIMTLCELSTSEYQPAPMECTEVDFSNKKCMNAFMRSPQQWTTYSNHMHNIRNSCYRYQREHDIDIARELYRNITEGQLELLRTAHQQQLAMLKISNSTHHQVQLMETSLGTLQARISELETSLRGNIFPRLETVAGLLERLTKEAIPSAFRKQISHLERSNKEHNAVLMQGTQQVVLFLHESIRHNLGVQEQRSTEMTYKLHDGLRSALLQLGKDLQAASSSMQQMFRQGVSEISSDMIDQHEMMKGQIEQSLSPLDKHADVLAQQVGLWSSTATELLALLTSAVDGAETVKQHHQDAMVHVDTMVQQVELSGGQLIARLNESASHINETTSQLGLTAKLQTDYRTVRSLLTWLTGSLRNLGGLHYTLRWVLWLVVLLQARSVFISCANMFRPLFVFFKQVLSVFLLLASRMSRHISYGQSSESNYSIQAPYDTEKGWNLMQNHHSSSANGSSSDVSPSQRRQEFFATSIATRYHPLVPIIPLQMKVNRLQPSQSRFSRIPEYLVRSSEA